MPLTDAGQALKQPNFSQALNRFILYISNTGTETATVTD